MLTITHRHEAGTLIDGTSRGDGTAEILKANRWRWGRSINTWYVPHSRDHQPNMSLIACTADALRAQGFTVEVEIDRTHRATAEVEADKIARQVDRVAALEAKAERKSQMAEGAWAAEQRMVAQLPEGGEPIKIGHHSETWHRNAIEKAHLATRRAIEADTAAQTAGDRAAAAAHTTDARYNPVTVANRIQKLAADIRRIERETVADVYNNETGYQPATPEQIRSRSERVAPRLTELSDQLAYWEGVRTEQIATGQAGGHSRDTIRKGDAVKIRGTWRRVVRVNQKTVSVDTEYSWTDTAPYAEIQEVVPAVQVVVRTDG